MELHLKIIGLIFILLALVHGIFPRYFKWTQDLNSLSLVNRQMMIVHTFFIALTVLMMGILCLTSSAEITGTPLGRKISLGLGIFWLFRLLIQFLGYSSELWKGKKFETIVHIGFSFLWAYVSIIFLSIYVC
jgi:hypothetical protein